ncbi:MAG: hypothetical protein EP344_12205 [Bacteroidetes bacterium]|nr:MAG: hypothetical protein EP344_12205 [Bacteroidota bacterium]
MGSASGAPAPSNRAPEAAAASGISHNLIQADDKPHSFKVGVMDQYGLLRKKEHDGLHVRVM